MIVGARTMWPGSDQLHWEIRRGYTIFGYNAPAFIDTLEVGLEAAQSLREDSILSLDRHLADTYRRTCYEHLAARVSFYDTILPASTYRRTSENFDMTGVDELRIGAKVDREHPDTVLIHHGTALAIEDAAQALLTRLASPLDLDLGPSEPVLLRARSHRFGTASFVDYQESASDERHRGASEFPAFLSRLFLVTPSGLTRQMFADHLATMALLWVIGHEDAHKYCGHLAHFQRLGIADQDALFSELRAQAEGAAAHERRAAELQADTCTTMRMVDYCYDAEFLGIITDWMSHGHRRQIWGDSKESAGLGPHQRNLLLRLIALSGVLPLAVFSAATASDRSVNAECYPTFATRAMNLIMTVASRAIDTQMTHPGQATGSLSGDELFQFFCDALRDTANVIAAFEDMTGVVEPSTTGVDFDAMAPGMFATLIGFQGDPRTLRSLGVDYPMKTSSFGAGADPLLTLIRERHAMDLCRAFTFVDGHRAANPSRADKVAEDIQRAVLSITQGMQSFEFLARN